MPRRLHLIVAVALGALATAFAGTAAADRPATSSERAAIRTVALRSLDGRGWRVSAIRVSTVTPQARYAKAAVDNVVVGTGGEMILARRGGQWRRVFLGTNDFCTAKIPTAALNDLGFGC